MEIIKKTYSEPELEFVLAATGDILSTSDDRDEIGSDDKDYSVWA